jgi:hypothetical protein
VDNAFRNDTTEVSNPKKIFILSTDGAVYDYPSFPYLQMELQLPNVLTYMAHP